MKLFTIGFTKTSAESFFRRLKSAGVESVTDVRLKTDSQLSGFAKSQDLSYFLRELIGVSYRKSSILAPTKEILSSYQKKEMSWDEYSHQYTNLLVQRRVEHSEDVLSGIAAGTCFLCSEHDAHHCHRRLAAEYLSSRLGQEIEIVHL